MTRNIKIDINTLLEAFDLYEQGYSFLNVIKMLSLNTNHRLLNEKYQRYKLYGVNGLLPKTKNNSYSSSFKLQIINEYFEKGISPVQLAIKYNIPSDRTVRNWIKRYTMGKENKTYSPKPEVYTMKARKTNLEERIEIVKDYIESNSDYKTIADKYSVTYGQVYNWVKKYKNHGNAGLEDGRGKGKPQSIMTEDEIKDAEIKALKERNKYLEMENEVLKKPERIRKRDDESKSKQIASYKTIKALKNKYPIKWLCSVLGINRSSYYKWTNRKPSKREIENNTLMEDINDIYHQYQGIYGYRRIYIYIRLKLNKHVNHKRVYRLMKQLKLKAIIRRKAKRYKLFTPEVTAQNILNRSFNESKKNKKWLTDVTEFKLKNGNKIYLSAIYDLGSKTILSYELSSSNNNQLVFNTLEKAVKQVKNTKGIIFHSDRGFQYTSRSFKAKLKEYKMIQSMSRVGCCIDNGPMESVWGMMKSEIYKGNKNFSFINYEQAVDELTKYIHFYNTNRITLKMAESIA
ncbi:IS3 family transposase [Mammaliicoccus sciuri]|uniref:IS3 family transposase n=1 Tax=Mammaliicoccus sciuri TaxID=1296 RepID=UPI000E6A1474|nr:IS3 family transposase [Mammaliicoccus sciuri]RIN88125.1 IS3 family transposase [Mammaliicoccus sciuri]